MPKPNSEVKGIVIASQGTEARVTLKASAKRAKEMGASDRIMRLFEPYDK